MTLRQAGVTLIDCVHATPAAVEGGYPYIGIPQMKDGRLDFDGARKISDADFAKWTVKAKPQMHDIVLSRRTNPGVIAPVRENTPFALGQNLVLLRASGECVAPAFLRWLASSPFWWDQIAKFLNVGAVFDSLRCADVPNFELPVPPMRDQEAIADLLSGLDDKIELNRRMNETLERQARALFRDWFVDFGPVKARQAGDAPYLAPDLWSLFPDRLDDDGLPEGWEQSVLGNHTLNFDSKRVPLSKAQRSKRQGEFPYHGATSVMDHIDSYLFDGIYTLIGEDGSVTNEAGRAFTQYVFGRFWVNNHAHVLQGKHPVSTEQILLYFRHEMVTPFVTGAVQLKLSQGRMNSMPFIYAGAEVCGAFNDVVTPLFNRIRSNELENRTLAQTRDLLLPKLMSGEIRVGEAEKELERA